MQHGMGCMANDEETFAHGHASCITRLPSVMPYTTPVVAEEATWSVERPRCATSLSQANPFT